MSESTDYFPPEESPPARSGWRRALVGFTLLGAASYGFGLWAARDDSGAVPATVMIMTVMLGPVLALLGFALWWVLLGDRKWYTRILSVFGLGVASIGVVLAAHPSMRPYISVWGVPLTVVITGLVLAAVPAIRRLPTAALVALIAASPWLALRVDGVTGAYEIETSYRWKSSVADSAAEQFADRATVLPASAIADLGVTTPVYWAGFRGANRTGEVPKDEYRGWDGTPPRERWRNDPVGPAWSSFCIVGDYLFTQEQRGDSESVVCYRADTGKEIWSSGAAGKHSDGQSGAGPRATPAYANGRLFATSASGSVSCLKANTGETAWTVNLADRFKATKPNFGLSTSPLVAGDLVIVNPASPAAPRLVALDAATGETRWATEASGTAGYSSPQAAKIAGVDQVLIFNGAGLFGHDPQTGKELWAYDWVTKEMEPTTVQPLVLPDGRVVVGGGNVGIGTRCVKVQHETNGWLAKEEWKTTKFTPKFNDMVRAGDYLYGLENGVLLCLKLSNGTVAWKDGRYGAGQLLLAGDKLLVISEEGELACVPAKPDEYEELWKIKLAKGKAWNHPVLARGRLYFRNATVMVALDLPGWTDKE